MKLGKDVFVALAAVGWADGEVSVDEADSLLHAARECGIEGAELDSVKKSAREKVELDAVKALTLTVKERMFVYAIATWLARIDGVVMPEEREMLFRLGKALKLADGDKTRASAASFSVAQLSEGERPSRYDIAGLAARLDAILAASIPPGKV